MKSRSLYLDNCMRKSSQVFIKITRATRRDKCVIPFLKTSKAQRSIKYQRPNIWKSLDANIKNCNSLKLFKIILKESFLNKYLQCQNNRYIAFKLL